MTLLVLLNVVVRVECKPFTGIMLCLRHLEPGNFAFPGELQIHATRRVLNKATALKPVPEWLNIILRPMQTSHPSSSLSPRVSDIIREGYRAYTGL
jgi:hypothetical protein